MTASILYITRNGILEPLGQSQVLAYLKRLATNYDITLISFEKASDFVDAKDVARVRLDCEVHGIRWLPQQFHHRPRLLASAFDTLTMLLVTAREVRRGNARLVHARSYIPAAVALVVGRLTGTPFIFDMRALWPEEMITAGRLKRGSVLHRLILWIEGACIRHAAATVSLTHAATPYLEELYGTRPTDRQFTVIPTCADLGRFVPAPAGRQPKALLIGCIGTVLSGWFKLDWLCKFYSMIAKLRPDAKFEIITRDDRGKVLSALTAAGVPAERIEVYPLSPDQMPAAIQLQSASVMFYAEAVSELGRSPTRVGEILGCGIPVVANPGVGDVADIICRHNVGILVESDDVPAMEEAANRLLKLLEDEDLPRRCRAAAEEHFSLEQGVRAYDRLYRRILDIDNKRALPNARISERP